MNHFVLPCRGADQILTQGNDLHPCRGADHQGLVKNKNQKTRKDIDIFFETQGIHTLTQRGELVITLFAACAQMESQSLSENVKWGINRSGLFHPREGISTINIDSKYVYNHLRRRILCINPI